jgi:long-chain acyl-CoA synthetase
LTQWNEDLISVDSARTLDGLLVQRIHRSPDGLAYRSHDRASDTWIDLTWNDVGRQVARWQEALAAEDLDPGDRVALLLRNGPEWVQFDQASLGLGLVVVPLYTDDRADNVAYILQDAAVKLLLIQDSGRWKRLAPALKKNKYLKRVVLLDAGKDTSRPDPDHRVVAAARWLPAGGRELRKRRGDPHSLASIVYTSGTTGRPKGVMLSHHNMLSVAHASLTVIDCYQQDLFLSFLPLSHTLERTAGYYLPMMAGAGVAYSRSVAQLADDLQIVRPTALIAVPRIFERVYGRIKDQLTKQPAFHRWLFDATVRVGWRRFRRQQGRAGWRLGQVFWPLLRRLVADKIMQRLGGRLRIAVSGGAPLSPEVARVFLALGVPLLQGYGLTESSPVVSVNPFDDNDPASVGVPLRGIEVRIGEADELLVRSPGVMLGYWNNHAATAEMIDANGWLHTGDQARINGRHIYITGRIKDILVLSNGEKVPPADMEMAIALDPLFEQVLVLGEGRPYLTALVVLNADLWPGLAQECGLDPMAYASLEDPRLLGLLQRRIKAALKDFPGFAKIRRVTALLEPWTVDNGLMTPTLKVKRKQVLDQYGPQVRAMYDEGPAAA